MFNEFHSKKLCSFYLAKWCQNPFFLTFYFRFGIRKLEILYILVNLRQKVLRMPGIYSCCVYLDYKSTELKNLWKKCLIL